jgi:Uma2 family endonuclease
MAVEILRRRFTVEQYHRMAEAGVFADGDRVELIEGEIVEMTPIGSRHAAQVDRLNDLLTSTAGRRAIVRVQNPIRIGSHSEPQPDLVLLRRRDDYYRAAHPEPRDVLLVVEVSDTTIDYDRSVKVPLYARAGIPHVLIVDVSLGSVEDYRDPSPAGYRVVAHPQRGQHVTIESLPDLRLSVGDILG